MKNSILTFLAIFLLLPLVAGAQTVSIEHAQYAFTIGKKRFIDTLKAEGFKVLTVKEIEDDQIKNGLATGQRVNIKDYLYAKNGLQKDFELKKQVYGGMCSVSILMKEPACKVVDKIYWNANLTLDAGSYVRILNQMGYEQVIENNLEKYVNKSKGLILTLRIFKRTNEIAFMMTRIE